MLAVLLALSLWAITTAANFIIEYNWWKEVGQVGTWISMLWYSIAPFAAGAAGGLHCAVDGSCAGAALRRHPPTGFPFVLPADYGRAGDRGDTLRLGLD